MPLALVSSTAVVSKNGFYLFGGISEEIDLTGPELNLLQYDFEKEKWEFLVNFATISPFINSRFLKPNICSLGDEIFLFFQKKEQKYVMEVFELKMGGFSLKFEEKSEESQGGRMLQSELSLCFNAGVLYNLEEGNRDLLIWDVKNLEKFEIKKVKSLQDENDEDFKEFERKVLNN